MRHIAFIIGIATSLASCGSQSRPTDPFFKDEPTRRLTDADVASIANRFDDAKNNNHGRLRLGTHNGVMVLDDHIRSDICPDNTISIIHYDAEPGASCEKIGGITKEAVVPAGIGIGTQSFCIHAPLVAAQCKLLLEQWRHSQKQGARVLTKPSC
jgi:hypothetical protein